MSHPAPRIVRSRCVGAGSSAASDGAAPPEDPADDRKDQHDDQQPPQQVKREAGAEQDQRQNQEHDEQGHHFLLVRQRAEQRYRSSTIVTGPSFSSSTFMRAPNTPRWTRTPTSWSVAHVAA